ncbi:4a-hydroxytetrahydrobiopterin dehydratase [Thalassobacillus cyri]|uniref:4a-hydroxytetrahydrobiopterin dehydratase n=1 Tax=Thalassobacillus cyri TaxID=571932 RepID=A0A1H3YZ01_9BACI|nr:4a-hydroxytetrahydrobiopterin dehydratase [Thalassobacillus cyri]SEA16284.1 4a-hydroxytetrahydrobiopterin dehydratase [Thalassobacillus cyri]
MERLSDQQKNQEVSKLKGWKLEDDKWIVKRYRFKRYLSGIHFVEQVAEYAEEIQHHPLIHIDYKVVTMKLTSWNAKGLTDLDIRSAEEYDRIYGSIKE